jgi:hypothetical protein
MLVRNKSTGKLVYIDPNEFNAQYEQVNDPRYTKDPYANVKATAPQEPDQLGQIQQDLQRGFVGASGNPLQQGRYGDAWEDAQNLFSKSKSAADVISEVRKQGGGDLIDKARTKDERIAVAQEILDAGGVVAYKQLLPLKELATEKEIAGLEAKTDLLTQINMAQPAMAKEKIGGTGPIVGLPGISALADIFGSPEGREARATPEAVRATYQQMISGKVVSDREAARLKAFLPLKTKTETQNAQDLERLAFRLELNMKLFERAKRENLTPNEAYDKYGKEMVEDRFNELFAEKPVTTGERIIGEGVKATGPLGITGAQMAGYNLPPGNEAVQALAPVASAIGLGGLAAMGLGGVATAGGAGIIQKILNPSSAIAQQRAAEAAKTPLPNLSKAIEVGQKYVNKFPQLRSDWKTWKTALEKSTDMNDLLDTLTTMGKMTYTGRDAEVRAKLAATMTNNVYQKAREIIQVAAPKIAQSTGQLQFLKNLPRTLQQGTWLALKARLLGGM